MRPMGRMLRPGKVERQPYAARGNDRISAARANLVLYAGVLAPHSESRADVVDYARPSPSPDEAATETQVLLRVFHDGHAARLSIDVTVAAIVEKHARSS